LHETNGHAGFASFIEQVRARERERERERERARERERERERKREREEKRESERERDRERDRREEREGWTCMSFLIGQTVYLVTFLYPEADFGAECSISGQNALFRDCFPRGYH